MKHRSRIRMAVATAVTATVLIVGATAPASAWSSRQIAYSPSGCSGGYLGSSWYSGSQASASSSGGGSCFLSTPKYRAAVRYTWGMGTIASSNSYAKGTGGYNSSALGGSHGWFEDNLITKPYYPS